MRWTTFFSLLLLPLAAFAADKTEKPCTIHADGKYYDLNPLSSRKDYEFKSPGGHDFILNVCRAITHETWGMKNEDPNQVAGYVRRDHGDFSIGKVNTTLSFQDGHVQLHYTDGSACKSTDGLKASTTIEFACDTSVFAAGRPRLVAQFPPEDEKACGFLIEWKTHFACPTSEHGAWGFFAVLVVLIVMALMGYLVLGTLYNRFVLGLQGFDQVPRFSFAGMAYHSQQAFEYFKDMLAQRSLHLPTSRTDYEPPRATNPVSHQSNVDGMQGMGLGHRDRAWRGRGGGAQQQANPISHQAQIGLASSPPSAPTSRGLQQTAPQASDATHKSGDEFSGKELGEVPPGKPNSPGSNGPRDEGSDVADIRGRGVGSDSVIRL
ncbi:hypothetical protein HGRIS_008799 [Hohenbuehelia grisea]|uniref:Autophagy-related protein 27 n=1 Tax=Hohenbuehelia grisea TaxID=104357 RepID=A0ABR3J919_9AGAR